jgi:hypothetical protein
LLTPLGKAALALGAVGALLLTACSAPPATEATIGTESSPIINGTASDASQNEVVLLFNSTASYNCTATLVAPNLALTARHCVSAIESDVLECDQNGNAISGGQIGADFPVADLQVFVGVTRDGPFPPATAQATQIFHDDSTNLCNHDLALLLLDQSIPGALVGTLRLDAGPSKEDSFTIIGWGVTTAAQIPLTRQQRTDVGVLAIGSTTYQGLPVPPDNFVLGESICNGDSGSPAISEETGAIVGIASFGSNGTTPNPNDPSAACVQTPAGVTNLFTEVTPFKAVIEQAFAAAGAQPVVDDSVPGASGKSGCAVAHAPTDGALAVFAAFACVGAGNVRRRRRILGG